jgi:hypothetical protein
MRRIDERIHAVALAIDWFERDRPKTIQKRARSWIDEWRALARATQDAVVERWRRGELTTQQAIFAMDEEMRRSQPKMWTFLGR